MPLVWHEIDPVERFDEAIEALKPFGVSFHNDRQPCVYYRERGTGILIKEIATKFVYADGRIECWARYGADDSDWRVIVAEAEKWLTKRRPRASDNWTYQRATKDEAAYWWATLLVPAENDDPMQQLVAAAKVRDRQIVEPELDPIT